MWWGLGLFGASNPGFKFRSARGRGASGLGAESMGKANTRREKSLLMNRMTYARKQISRNEK